VVECDLAKVEVAGSNPVSRSNPSLAPAIHRASYGWQARTLALTSRRASVGKPTFAAIDDDSDLLFRALLLPRLDAAGISLHPVPTGAVAKW
jgi:hypothetical protein